MSDTVVTPVFPYRVTKNGTYAKHRVDPSDGSCSVHGYPCYHPGVDMHPDKKRGGTLTAVAPDSGVVVDVFDGESSPFRGYGPAGVLIHGSDGYFQLLAHLERGTIVVDEGDHVVAGQRIGGIYPAWDHCHWEVRRKRTGEWSVNTLDPHKWLRARRWYEPAIIAGVGLGALLATRIRRPAMP